MQCRRAILLFVLCFFSAPDCSFTYRPQFPICMQEEQPLAALIALTQHLEGARFQAFWQAADSCREILASVPGYYDAIRAYIVLAISSTCQKFSKQLLGECLMLDGPALTKLVCRLSHLLVVTAGASSRRSMVRKPMSGVGK